MISGVVAQSRIAVSRGTIFPTTAFFDDDGFPTVVIAFDTDRVVSAGLVTDIDNILLPTMPQVIVSSPGGTFVGGEAIYATSIRQDLVLTAGLYTDTDSIRQPDIRIPGVLQPVFKTGDDIVFVPTVVAPGSTRPALYFDVDSVYAPLVEVSQVLRPIQQYNDTDAFYAPTARIGLGPSVFVDSDSVFAPTLPLLPQLMASDDQFYVPSIGFLATLNGDTSNTTVSSDQLTATHTAAVNDSGARSTSLRVSGKFYFEATIGATHGQADAVGILTMNGTFADSPQARNVTADYSTTTIWSNNNNWGNLGTWVAGDHIGVAINLDNRRAWFRRNNGNWNNVSTDDPAANTGGVTIAPTVPFGPFVGFGGSTVGNAGDNITVNFGQSAFSMAQPAGFKLWPAISEVKKLSPQTVTDDIDNETFGLTGVGNFNNTIAPDLYTDSETPYPPGIGFIIQTLAPQVLTDSDTIYPTSTPRQWVISASRAGVGSVVVYPSEDKTQIISNIGAVK